MTKPNEPVVEEQPDIPSVWKEGAYTFMGLKLHVGPGALVPRQETELLGREAVRVVSEVGDNAFVIDMCCGSGNLACAIASHVPAARVWASDLTQGCVELARQNVRAHGLESRVRVFQGDLFEPLKAEQVSNVDVIVCNPPYISTGRLESDRKHLLEHEPREAFDGGPYGLAIHQRVIKEAVTLLKPGGFLLFEFGLGQERQMKALFDRARVYTDVRFLNNAAGLPRAVAAKKT